MKRNNPHCPDFYQILKKKIKDRSLRIGVIGLGYVGLPLSIEFAKKNFKVMGFDIEKKKIHELMKRRRSYILDVASEDVRESVDKGYFTATDNFRLLKEIDAGVICVPTPWSKTGHPDISKIIQTIDILKRRIKKGVLVILESTTYPGTTAEIILPMLEKEKFVVGKDVFLCFSPERIDPGNKQYPFSKIPKIIGGITPRCLSLGSLFYKQVIEKIFPVSSTITAETVKLLENTFRLINIGFINEFAMLCNKIGVNVWEAIEAASTKPFGFMPFYPGPGIGGECIPADPQYLAWKARTLGVEPRMIDSSTRINLYMREYIVSRIQETLNERAQPLKGAKILMMGLTYKRDISDIRESPSLGIMEILLSSGARVSYLDPFVKEVSLRGKIYKSLPLGISLRKYDMVVIATDHSLFDYRKIKEEAGLIFDCRGVYKKKYKNVISL